MSERGRFIRKLESIVGREYVIHHPDDLLVYEYDGSVDKAIPRAVVLPASTDEVSRVLAVADEAGVPVVGRGSGTGLSGGAIALQDGLQVALTRMNRILEIDEQNRLAVVEPGVINLHLDQAARKRGLRYAPDPSSQKACSLGGNVAENAGGPHCLAYGVTSNHVLGMEVVLEDGSVTWLGGKMRNPVGYDLRGAFVGSERNVWPGYQDCRSSAANTSHRQDLPGRVFRRARCVAWPFRRSSARGWCRRAMEIMDALTIEAVQRVTAVGPAVGSGRRVLLVELEGEHRGGGGPGSAGGGHSDRVGGVGGPMGGVSPRAGAALVGSQECPRRFGCVGAKLLPGRRSCSPDAPHGVLGAGIGDKLHYGIPIANVFHAGDGNLHPCILFDERKPGEVERVMEVGGRILEVCVEMGGALSGEHGIGLEKKAYMPLVFTDADMEVMMRVGRAFAPQGRLNPGKVFPGGPEYNHSMQRGQFWPQGLGPTYSRHDFRGGRVDCRQGESLWLVPEADLASYDVDGLIPSAAVRPPSVDALSEVVALANEEGLATIPLGGMTQRSWGILLVATI